MGPGKVEGVGVVLEEEGLVVGQGVALAEDAPNAVAGRKGAIVPLVLLQAGEFVDEGLVNDKVLVAVGSGGLVFVGPEARGEEAVHLEMGIAQQGREYQARGCYLGQEGAIAVAYDDRRMFLPAHLLDEDERFTRM